VGTAKTRLVSVTLVAVLFGAPAIATACAFDCAMPATRQGAAHLSVPTAAGCHEASPTPHGVQLDRGDRDNCRHHVLPGDGAAAVLTAVPVGMQPPATLAVQTAPAAAVTPAAMLAGAHRSRGRSPSSAAIARPPLVLRI
jgi:hypothetical protein